MWATMPRSASWVTVPRPLSAMSWAIFQARSTSWSRSAVVRDSKYIDEKIPESRSIQPTSRKIGFA